MPVTARFTLNIEPFSINRTHYRDKRYLTPDYKNWQMRLFTQLALPHIQAELEKIRAVFDPIKHRFVVKLTSYYPVLLNKAGEINSHTEDLSNTEKQTVDCLFLPKYHVLPTPYGAPNINADDKSIVRLISSKKQATSRTNSIEICIRIISV